MQDEINLRQMSKLLACVWLLTGFTAMIFVAFALFISLPIGWGEVSLASAFAAIFGVVPIAVAWVTVRTKSWLGIGWSVSGLMVWSSSLSWVITNA